MCHTKWVCFSETLGLTPSYICRIHVGHVVFPNTLKRATQIGESSLSCSVTLTKIAVFLQSKICVTSGSNYSFKNHSVSQHWKCTQHWKRKLINTEVSSYPTAWVTLTGTKQFLESLSLWAQSWSWIPKLAKLCWDEVVTFVWYRMAREFFFCYITGTGESMRNQVTLTDLAHRGTEHSVYGFRAK